MAGRVLGIVGAAGLVCGLCSIEAQQAEPSWGRGDGAFRTRLVANKASYAIDEPIELRLELLSEAKSEERYSPPQGIHFEGGLVVKRDGQPVRYISGPFQTGGADEAISPGAQQTIGVLTINELWGFRQPGRYTIQFPETKELVFGPAWSEDEPDRTSVTLPASNVLEIEVQAPPDGRIPPLDIRQRVQVLTLKDAWNPSGRDALAASPGDWGFPPRAEAIVGALAIDWGEGPPPIHEDRTVVLLMRLTNRPADEELTVEKAEIDGSAIHIAVKGEGGSLESEWVSVFFHVGLERLLPPGEYACEVSLTAPTYDDQGGTETSTQTLGFTVLPGR